MTHTIAITDKGCDPDLIEIMAGDRVMWRNDDTAMHRIVEEATGSTPAAIDTGDLIPGMTSATMVFPTTTLASFACKYNLRIRGAVVVIRG